jgi:hypothetical protein
VKLTIKRTIFRKLRQQIGGSGKLGKYLIYTVCEIFLVDIPQKDRRQVKLQKVVN